MSQHKIAQDRLAPVYRGMDFQKRHANLGCDIQGDPGMTDQVTIWTYDWVPDGPRGYVRDLRLRWALEEAGVDYAVASVPFDNRGPDHLARQPFAQVPFLDDGDIRIFESGACLLHLAQKSEKLMQTRRKRKLIRCNGSSPR